MCVCVRVRVHVCVCVCIWHSPLLLGITCILVISKIDDGVKKKEVSYLLNSKFTVMNGQDLSFVLLKF